MEERAHIIVCGTDGSAAGQRALEWALEEAIRRSCKVRVVTAWAWDGGEDIAATSSPADARSHAQQIQDVAVARALAATDNPPEVEKVLMRGAASEGLCTSALDAELMVLGSHGHSAVHDKLVGSTSQRVIHHASCPVVILPDPRHALRAPRPPKGRRRGAEPPRVSPMF